MPVSPAARVGPDDILALPGVGRMGSAYRTKDTRGGCKDGGAPRAHSGSRLLSYFYHLEGLK